MRGWVWLVVLIIIVVGIANIATAQPFKQGKPFEKHGYPPYTNVSDQLKIQEQEYLQEHLKEKEKKYEKELEKGHGIGKHKRIKEHKMVDEELREKLRERIKERIRDIKIKNEIVKVKIKIKEMKKACDIARENYEKARHRYMELKVRGLNDPEAFRWAKQYLCFGVDYVERWLERLRVQVQNANMGEDQKERLMIGIENCLTALKESKARINDTTNPEELREAVEDLRKTWNEIKIEIKSIIGQIAVAKLEILIDKAEDVTVRIEGEIEALENAGVNVSKLKELLDDCSEKLDLAREKLEVANEKFEEMPDADNPNELYVEGRHLLKEVRDLIKEAFADIKKIYHEIRHLRVGHIFFGNETGELLVVGSGSAEIKCSGIVVVLATGNLTVTPSAAIVTVVGFKGGVEGGVSKISGHGKAVIRGENVTVKVDGDFMRIFVKGKGTATLEGEGIYKLKKLPHERMVEDTFSGTVTLEFGVVE